LIKKNQFYALEPSELPACNDGMIGAKAMKVLITGGEKK
jgi:hypothetical protein